jgi:FKBP-type peptidyl-prolyl cis-trans isomerase
MNWNRLSLLLFFIILSLFSCKDDEKKSLPIQNEKELKAKLIEFNKNKVTAEDRIIDDFVAENYPDAITSNTGVRYLIYPSGDSIELEKKEVAIVHYSIESLGREQFYTTEKNGPEKIWIGHEDVPSGLHESLLLLSPGDSAIFIMPSNRAYGLTGDQGNIPKNAILIYHIELIDFE